MRHLIIIILLTMPVLLAATWDDHASVLPHADAAKKFFKTSAIQFSRSTDSLDLAIRLLDSNNKSSIKSAKTALGNCRIAYKRFSFLLDYFFPHVAKQFNAPSKTEVEEPDMEFDPPHGLQYIEELLFNEFPAQKKAGLLQQLTVLTESAHDLTSLAYQWNPSDSQLSESMHLELIRVMTLYIQGYDAPFLKSGIRESQAALNSIRMLSEIIFSEEEGIKKVLVRIDAAIQFTRSAPDFDYFDRMTFISSYALLLEKEFNALTNKKGDLFSEIKNPYACSNAEMIGLGKQLFSEKILSGDKQRSCASCHQPVNYFTDHLTTNREPGTPVNLLRNTPTLFYASFQTVQFLDGRVKTIPDQIKEVLGSSHEMNISVDTLEQRLTNEERYKNLFAAVFFSAKERPVRMEQVAKAVSAYIGTLNPMDSRYDQYMAGKKQLTRTQIRGGNLFMGKAQCGTCHFLPYFNGLVPPMFSKTEFEVIGVPEKDDLKNATADTDAGRYVFFASPFYQGAFKTPTLRNISRTGPYMHNGKFRSLKRVLDFYNAGGGVGLGLPIEQQTLSSRPLHLSKKEIRAIISFLKTLTDENG